MEKTLRAVLVGCGGISQAWLEPVTKIAGLAVVGLADLLPENARRRAEQFGLDGVAIDTDFTRLLDRTRPDIVFDCAVPEAHVDVTLEALARGCHVLGEKPLASSMSDARRMVAAARAADRQFAVMQNRRYMPAIRAVQQFLAGGAIGALTTLNSDFFLAPHFGGFREAMRHPLLLDMAIHTFDQARLISGAQPLSVYCKAWNPRGSWYAHGASAVAIFEMTGGVIYTYRGSWCAEGLPTSWEADWRAVGERGTLLWDGGGEAVDGSGISAEASGRVLGFDAEHAAAPVPPYQGPKTGGHGGVIRDFVRCIREGLTPETTGADNIHSLAMVFAAIESADTGLPVQLIS